MGRRFIRRKARCEMTEVATATINTGGPAFPRAGWGTEEFGESGAEGQSLRDHFAAHAVRAEPGDVPDWFPHTFGPTAPIRPAEPESIPESLRGYVRHVVSEGLGFDELDDAARRLPGIRQYLDDMSAFYEARAAVDRAKKLARWAAYRYAVADALIAARECRS
jgi:hypothetical protein